MVLGAIVDITDRKAKEAALLRSEKCRGIGPGSDGYGGR
jgi:hypothetical protein